MRQHKIIAAVTLIVLTTSAYADAPLPGTLLSSMPMAGAPVGAKAWRIRYTSRTDGGQPEEVTGVVVAPTGTPPPDGRSVLAWAHGTVGVAEKCALSRNAQFFALTPGLTDALARGYTVVATDYPGLGTPQAHPYLVGDSEARAVLDSVRAARHLPDAAAGLTFAVWGESQGGHAALFTGEIARTYAPELKLVGVAAAAPTTDLVANLNGGADPSVRAFITAFATYSWSRHFGVSLSTIGTRSTQRLISRLAQNCVTTDSAPRLVTKFGVVLLRRALKGVDLGRTEPWAGFARANSAGRRPPGAPLFIAQNPKDVIVAPDVTLAFAKRACARGTPVQYEVIDGKGHETSGADSAAVTLNWIDARFGNKPAPSECSKFE